MFGLFERKLEPLVAFDLGSSSVKMLELEVDGENRYIASLAREPLPADIFTNNVLTKPDAVADVLNRLCESHGIEGKRVVTAIPTPSAFTKRIRMNKVEPKELRSAVQFEAGNFIPHKLDAVKIDSCILGEVGKNQLDVLVVAVKNEVVEALLDCFALAGLDTAVVDVDSFALHNLVDVSYPEFKDKTVANLCLGNRHCSITITRQGIPLFTGDISQGIRDIAEEYAQNSGISVEQARLELETLKALDQAPPALSEAIERAAAECSRQLTFFWNTCGAEGGIDHVLLSGGGAQTAGLLELVMGKTEVTTSRIEAFRGFKPGPSTDAQLVHQLEPYMSVAAGLALRHGGDGAA